MLYTINGSLRFNRHPFETNPNQNGTANVVSDDSRIATLVSFNTGQLLGFSVKLLDFPAKAAHILYDLHLVLSHLVRHDIVRVLAVLHYGLAVKGDLFRFRGDVVKPALYGLLLLFLLGLRLPPLRRAVIRWREKLIRSVREARNVV